MPSLPLLLADVLDRAGIEEPRFVEAADAWFEACRYFSSVSPPPAKGLARDWRSRLPALTATKERDGIAARIRLSACWYACAADRLVILQGTRLPGTVTNSLEGQPLAKVFWVHPLVAKRDYVIVGARPLRSGGRQLDCVAA